MEKVKLFYWDAKPNLGDSLNQILTEKLFQVPIEKAEPEYCNAAFIGSILQKFLAPEEYQNDLSDRYRRKIKGKVHIWGSGFVQKECTEEEICMRDFQVAAVRGVLTRQRMEKICQKDLSDIALGDPGILASELLDAVPEKKYKLGIIPHYVDKELPCFQEVPFSDATVIDVQEEPIACIRHIAECEMVLSSSMHGLVIADSFGIPNARMTSFGKIIGGDYKYDDYYSSFGITEHVTYDLKKMELKDIMLPEIRSNYAVTKEMVEQKKKEMKQAFPF